MSSVEREAQVEEWNGQEPRRTEPRTQAHMHRSVADFAMIVFAAALVLAEVGWLSFLAYVAARTIF